MPGLTDQEYLLSVQYKDKVNLTARIRLHREFSTNAYGLMPWLFDQLNLPDEACVLDVGGGPGDLWIENQARIPTSWQIIHSDLSPQMISAARRKLQGLSQVTGYGNLDAQALPFPRDSLDAIVANFMLYHVPDRPRAFAEIRRVLKPGGQLFAATNGGGHLKEIPELIQRVDPDADWVSADRLFGLENGLDQLAQFFPEVILHRYQDTLIVTEAAPLVAYILSMKRSAVVEEDPVPLRRLIERMIEDKGAIHITKNPGMLIARK